MATRKGKDKRIVGVVVIGTKRYSIKLTTFPKEGRIVEVMGNFYNVKKLNFKEVRSGMIPVIYLTKTSKIPKLGK